MFANHRIPLPGRRRYWLSGVLTAALGATAQADDLHYNNMLLGERPMGMGGAYTAVSDDPSGLFYNPAGIVYSYAAKLSASVNAYQITNTTYKDALGSNNNKADWSRESSGLVPNYFGVTQPLGPFTVGFSYAVTDSIQEDLSQHFTDVTPRLKEFTVNLDNSDTVNKIGPSIAYALSDTFSVGLTLYFHKRDAKLILNQYARLEEHPTDPANNPNTTEWTNSYAKTTEYGIDPVFGLMWSPIDKLALGASVRRTFVISSTTDSQFTCLASYDTESNAPCDSNQVTPNQSIRNGINNDPEYPLNIRLGVAIFPSDSFLLSADFSYYTETNQAEATWNAALGTEYFLSRDWALRAGIFTNHANTPELVNGRTNQLEHIDYYGGSFSVSRFSRNSSVSLGVNYSMGLGEAQIVGGSAAIQDTESYSATFFLATSYSY